MPNPPSSPLPKIRIPRLRKEPPFLLLGVLFAPNRSRLGDTLLLLLLLPPSLLLAPSRRLLPLLAVQNKKDERGGQRQNHNALQDTVIFKVRPIAPGHSVIIHAVVELVIVLVVVLQEVVDPLAEGPVFRWGCGGKG